MAEIFYEDHFYKIIGEDARSSYISVSNGTMCVPLTDSGMVIFIQEPSPAFGKTVLMLPGGIVEEGETHQEAANRELQEEIGYKSLRLDYLGELHPWSKYLDLQAYVYLARELVPSKLHGDEIYEITTRLVPLHEFERLIQSGELQDSTVIAALYMAQRFTGILQNVKQAEPEQPDA